MVAYQLNLFQPSLEEQTPDLRSYDVIIVAFSGGKDSLACLLWLLDQGIPAETIELWHHSVDGGEGESTLMDWPCTPGYISAVGQALGSKTYFSWREGGFEREMLREESPTAQTWFETPQGLQVAGGKGKPDTRKRFPQVSADLSVRWCSSSLKIEVMSIAIRNQNRFLGSRTLVITGERAQESPSRAKYKILEPHRTHCKSRHVDHFRPVLLWDEKEIWSIIQKHRINPHPAYRLGFGRVSCACCIFSSANQWATLYKIAKEKVQKIIDYEKEFGFTINRNESIENRILKGTPYLTLDPELVKIALSTEYQERIILEEDEWLLPSGAYGESSGPV